MFVPHAVISAPWSGRNLDDCNRNNAPMAAPWRFMDQHRSLVHRRAHPCRACETMQVESMPCVRHPIIYFF